MNTKLSRPRFNSIASSWMFWLFGIQLIFAATSSSLVSRKSALVSKTCHTSWGSFLLAKHRRTPPSDNSLSLPMSFRCDEEIDMPEAPSSPTTPLHSVLSQSSTMAFLGGLILRLKKRTIRVAKNAKYSSLYGICPILFRSGSKMPCSGTEYFPW